MQVHLQQPFPIVWIQELMIFPFLAPLWSRWIQDIQGGTHTRTDSVIDNVVDDVATFRRCLVSFFVVFSPSV